MTRNIKRFLTIISVFSIINVMCYAGKEDSTIFTQKELSSFPYQTINGLPAQLESCRILPNGNHTYIVNRGTNSSLRLTLLNWFLVTSSPCLSEIEYLLIVDCYPSQAAVLGSTKLCLLEKVKVCQSLQRSSRTNGL